MSGGWFITQRWQELLGQYQNVESQCEHLSSTSEDRTLTDETRELGVSNPNGVRPVCLLTNSGRTLGQARADEPNDLELSLPLALLSCSVQCTRCHLLSAVSDAPSVWHLGSSTSLSSTARKITGKGEAGFGPWAPHRGQLRVQPQNLKGPARFTLVA